MKNKREREREREKERERERNATFTIFFTINFKWQAVINWQKSNFSGEFKLKLVTT